MREGRDEEKKDIGREEERVGGREMNGEEERRGREEGNMSTTNEGFCRQ